MAQLIGLIVTDDSSFRQTVGQLFRAGAVPVAAVEESAVRDGAIPDVVIVDARGAVSTATATIERMRLAASNAGIVAIASRSEPDLILQAMRAGANEFLTWPAAADVFHEALHRIAARRVSTQGGARGATTLAFLGAKGGSGTTTLAVNCAVDIARLTKRPTAIVDLKPSLGEVALFLGVHRKYSVLDALDNLHRLDREFLRELMVKHKSGVDILAASDQFDRPASSEGAAVEELLRLLAKEYDYVLIDAGSHVNAVVLAAMYLADRMFLVANPDIPSVRNTQRLLDRVQQLGASPDRIRLLLNRMSEPPPLPVKHIEKAVGRPVDHTFPSDYRTVSKAFNAGVPLALSDKTELSTQFDSFARTIVDPSSLPADPPVAPKKAILGLERVASLW
jgi:pilus assembly protein CpaE